ncbi:MAG: hypothetical protein J5733_12055 [Bacteroidaceae bacterium]|nr:hypothetical protein [Bacteroidaceae bacterium]
MKPTSVAKPEEPALIAAPEMKRDWRCVFGLHQYDVYKEIDIKDPRGIPVVKVIVLRCRHCGCIRSERIVINDTHYYSN